MTIKSFSIIDKHDIVDFLQHQEEIIGIVKDRIYKTNNILSLIKENAYALNNSNNLNRNRFLKGDNFVIDFFDNFYKGKSNAYIDYLKGIVYPPIMSIKNSVSAIYINNKDVTNALANDEVMVLLDKKLTIRVTTTNSIASLLTVEMLTASEYEFTIYADKKFIAADRSSGSLNITLDRVAYKEFTIELIFSKSIETTIKNVLIQDRLYIEKGGSLETKELNLYGNTGKIKVTSKESNDISLFCAIYSNVSNKYIYFDASKPIYLSDKDTVKKNIKKTNDLKELGLDVLYTMSNNIDKSSIILYRGFMSFEESLIRGAFVSDDMDNIDYSIKDIVYKKYVDIDNHKKNLKAGEMLLLNTTFECEQDVYLNDVTPILLAGDLEKFKIKILINGKKAYIKDNMINVEISKGINNISIFMYVWKKNEDDLSDVEVLTRLNLKKFFKMVYVKKLLNSNILENVKGNDNFFYIKNNNILIDMLSTDDNILFSATEFYKSEFHITENDKQYIKIKVLAMLNSGKSYLKNIKIGEGVDSKDE